MVYQLKLIRGRSYIGCGIHATSAAPHVSIDAELKDTIDYLVDCKRFELVGTCDDAGEGRAPMNAVGQNAAGQNSSMQNATEQNSTTDSNQSSPTDTPNTQWTRNQLMAYAAENGIDIEGATAKADILAKITEAENAIDYGEND